jgi:transposase InsO family protein
LLRYQKGSDNGKEFTDRLFGLRKRAQSGKHEFDKLCTALNIEHRLTPPRSPQTNGMVERFNGRIEDMLQSNHLQSGDELEATLHRYVWLYNQQLPQSALGSKTPLQAIKDLHKIKPELFKKQPYYRPRSDTILADILHRVYIGLFYTQKISRPQES